MKTIICSIFLIAAVIGAVCGLIVPLCRRGISGILPEKEKNKSVSALMRI